MSNFGYVLMLVYFVLQARPTDWIARFVDCRRQLYSGRVTSHGRDQREADRFPSFKPHLVGDK